MRYAGFNEDVFRRNVDFALSQVKTVLDINRNPRYAEEEEHTYDDKYALAEFLTNTAIASQVNILERMGLTADKLRTLRDMVVHDKRSVSIRFECEDTCSFLKEQNVDVVSSAEDSGVVLETSKTATSTGMFGTASKKTETIRQKVSTIIKEYHWKVGVSYKIYCYAGSDHTRNAVELQSRSSSTIVITTGNRNSPFPARKIHKAKFMSMTWLLQNIKESEKQFVCCFKIDRTKETCLTPRRNADIIDALNFFDTSEMWSGFVARHFYEDIEKTILGRHMPANRDSSTKPPSLNTIKSSEVFCPVLPLFEPSENQPDTATRQERPRSLLLVPAPSSGASSPLLSVGDIDKFLNEQCRSLDTGLAALGRIYVSHQLVKLITVAEASLTLLLRSMEALQNMYNQSIEYIEGMLRKQLIAAIGKSVHAKDFDEFMVFHTKKLFAPPYAPQPFCYAIRRPDHYPDGMLSIEKKESDDKFQPVQTMVRSLAGDMAPPISVPISAATTFQVTGPRFLHAWMRHRFESSPPDNFVLSARARQFSSFMLIVGAMAGPDKFVPKDAVILQNKDEILIPLLLRELPTAKEFKDAISSLSPDQQRFAKSFRGMQLESSVVGVCVVQLKPQLEVLLGLPDDSLTKEIRLTQDLMSLFIDYQIPSDLLSFDGAEDASMKDKVDRVKEHVKSVMDVIDDAKKAELQEAERKAEMSVMTKSDSSSAVKLRGTPRRSIMMGGFASADYHAERAKYLKQSQTQQAASTSRLLPLSEQTPPASGKGVVGESSTLAATRGMVDFTLIPKQLDAKFEEHDTDNSLRATILKTSDQWHRKRQETLLTKPKESTLGKSDIRSEKNKAFDLLDALSRSGSLPIACAELHAILSITHSFESDVMSTVIQNNVNPIEKVEKSYLMVASTIHGVGAEQLVGTNHDRERLTGLFPSLLEEVQPAS